MKFIKPANIISYVGLKSGAKVADFGCGAGFYSVATSKAVGNTGQVCAIDVQDAKLTATKSASIQAGFHNVEVFKTNLEQPIKDLENGSFDLVITASILHEVKNREAVLKNAYALLKTDGQLLAVDWKVEPSPFGPSMDKRISAEHLQQLLEKMGLKFIKEIPADSYHYAFLMQK